MVNRGFSHGCKRCRASHVKCDLTRPSCHRCGARGLRCEGYRDFCGLLFKDESLSTARKVTKSEPRQTVAKHELQQPGPLNTPGPGRSLSQDPGSVSLCYWVQTFMTQADREPLTSRGHFDHLLRTFANTRSTSPLIFATNWVAGLCASHLFDQKRISVWQAETLGDTLKAMRIATSDPLARTTDETILAALVLDFGSQVSVALDDHICGTLPNHQTGVVALLSDQAAQAYPGSLIRGSLISAVRKNCLRDAIYSGFTRLNLAPFTNLGREPPMNPGQALDAVLVRAIQLQILANSVFTGQTTGAEFTKHVDDMMAFCKIVENELAEWEHQLPSHWHPYTSMETITHASKVQSLEVEHFPNIDVAYLYNEGRCTRLMTMAVSARCRIGTQEIRHDIQDLTKKILTSTKTSLQYPTHSDTRSSSGSYPDPMASTAAHTRSQSSHLGRWFAYNILKWLSAVLNQHQCLFPTSTRDEVSDFLLQLQKFKP